MAIDIAQTQYNIPLEEANQVNTEQVGMIQSRVPQFTEGNMRNFDQARNTLRDAAARTLRTQQNQINQQNRGFAGTGLQGALSQRAAADVNFQRQQGETDLASQFEALRQQALQNEVGALTSAGNLSLQGQSLTEQQRQFNNQLLQEGFFTNQGQLLEQAGLNQEAVLNRENQALQERMANLEAQISRERMELERQLKGRELTIQEQENIRRDAQFQAQLALQREAQEYNMSNQSKYIEQLLANQGGAPAPSGVGSGGGGGGYDAISAIQNQVNSAGPGLSSPSGINAPLGGNAGVAAPGSAVVNPALLQQPTATDALMGHKNYAAAEAIKNIFGNAIAGRGQINSGRDLMNFLQQRNVGDKRLGKIQQIIRDVGDQRLMGFLRG